MRRILFVAVLALWLVSGTLPTTAEQARGGRAGGAATTQKPAPPPAAAGMTNADVVKMVKAGLGEDVVIAAIKNAKERQFTLTPDGLVQLKTDGVPDRIITVMLDPNAPAAAPAAAPATSAPAPTPTAAGVPVNTALPVAEIALVTKEGARPIMPEGGDISQSYAFVRMVVWANFRGLKSDVRIADKRPAIQVKTNDTKFDTRFFLVKTEADEDDNVRSVRLKSGVYSVSTAFVPDEDWVIASKAEQESPGVWRMTLSKDLGRGEYGIMDTQNRYLYGFAIEK